MPELTPEIMELLQALAAQQKQAQMAQLAPQIVQSGPEQQMAIAMQQMNQSQVLPSPPPAQGLPEGLDDLKSAVFQANIDKKRKEKQQIEQAGEDVATSFLNSQVRPTPQPQQERPINGIRQGFL